MAERRKKLRPEIKASGDEGFLEAHNVIVDQLFERLDHLDARTLKLEARINYLFGALGVLVVVANVIVAIIK